MFLSEVCGAALNLQRRITICVFAGCAEVCSKGRLGVVFSDESLAYGVNMPFRTAFVGDPDHPIASLRSRLRVDRASGNGPSRAFSLVGNVVTRLSVACCPLLWAKKNPLGVFGYRGYDVAAIQLRMRSSHASVPCLYKIFLKSASVRVTWSRVRGG